MSFSLTVLMVLSALSIGAFFLITVFEKRKLKRYFSIEKSRVEICRKCIDLSLEVLKENERLNDYPEIRDYLMNAQKLLFFAAESSMEKYIELNVYNVFSARKEESTIRFMDEMIRAQKRDRPLMKLVRQTSDINGLYFKSVHPFKYRLSNFRHQLLVRVVKAMFRFIPQKQKQESFERYKLEEGLCFQMF